MAKALTAKQEAFAQHYTINQDATKAYRVAYDAAGMKESSIRANAHKLLRTDFMKQRIEELQKVVRQSATKSFEITAEKVLQELAKIAFANVQDYVRVDAEGIPLPNFTEVTRSQFSAIGEITFEDIETGQRTGKRVKFKLLDKKGALVDLGKHLGLFVEKTEHKHEHTFVDDAAADFDDRVAQLFARSTAHGDSGRAH